MARFGFFNPGFWRDENSEGALLRAVFLALVAGSVAMLALDLSNMVERSGSGTEDLRTGPVEMDPPKESDQERPYFPRAAPLAPGTRMPDMPGITDRPSASQLASRMTFAKDDKGNVSAVGRIEPGTAGEFERFISDNDDRLKRVYLHSPGGSVADAIAMAKEIRERSLSTTVPDNGYCASSCPLVFAGGTEREAGTKTWIGVHQVFTLASEVGTLHEGLANAQRISAECQDHLVAMGVDPRVWIYAMKTAKHRLYVFTPKELMDLKLVTPKPSAEPPRAKAG